MDQYASSPSRSTYCYAELAASFINFLHYCSPSFGFYGVGKDNRGRCTDNPSGCHLIWTIGAPISIIAPFLHRMPFLLNPPNLSWLGTAPNNAGLHTRWLGISTLSFYYFCILFYLLQFVSKLFVSGHSSQSYSLGGRTDVIVIGTAYTVCRARSMKWYGVHPSVCPNMGTLHTHCCRFAAVGPCRDR